MRVSSITVCVLVAGSLALLAGCGGGGRIESWSADQVQLNSNGDVIQTARLYVTPSNIRMEQPHPSGRGEMVIIFNKDEKVMRMLMPDQKSYLEMPLNDEELNKKLTRIPDNAEQEVLGTEKVAGFKCEKKRVKASVGFMGFARESSSIVWTTDKLDFPVRTESSSGEISELRNFKAGKPKSALFKVPKDFKKTSGMTGLMEMMGR
ncbi:MAG: DUF4412 domain-containing protein [Verrucomicrobia bacterium]|nr:DUF4412 domain-containing protein [Verrucomicrobiota bacterium]